MFHVRLSLSPGSMYIQDFCLGCFSQDCCKTFARHSTYRFIFECAFDPLPERLILIENITQIEDMSDSEWRRRLPGIHNSCRQDGGEADRYYRSCTLDDLLYCGLTTPTLPPLPQIRIYRYSEAWKFVSDSNTLTFTVRFGDNSTWWLVRIEQWAGSWLWW